MAGKAKASQRPKTKQQQAKGVIICPSCSFKNQAPLANQRCVSCGARIGDEPTGRETGSTPPAMAARRDGTFSLYWMAISLGVMAVLTGAIVLGLPHVIPAFDFEGSAGMIVAIPVWFVGGMLVGLMSPGRTLAEPVAAVFLVAVPTAYVLYGGQTVKTMPAFMYVLFGALGLLFTLIGTYAGERMQMSGQ